jgi:hypothetical protein
MFLSPTTGICDNSIRRHLEVIANVVAVAVVAYRPFDSYCIHRHHCVEMASGKALRRRRHDGVEIGDGNGRDPIAMTSATPIRGSVRLQR